MNARLSKAIEAMIEAVAMKKSDEVLVQAADELEAAYDTLAQSEAQKREDPFKGFGSFLTWPE